MSPRHWLMLALLVLVSAGSAISLSTGRDGHSKSERIADRGEARDEAANESREFQEPSDAMLARQLFGSGNIAPSDVWRRATARSRAIGRTTAQRATRAAGTDWEYIGPSNIGGRILDIALDPTQANTLYAATAGGGVWKSTDGGKTLSSIWPSDQTQNIAALVMTPSGVLYAGTGEAGPGGGSLTYGGTGIYRSDDRGASWRLIGLPTSSRIGRIVLDPTNEKRIFVAVTGSLYKPGGERGLYRSEDGGDHWTKVLAGDNATTGAVDVAIDPKNPKRMFAAMWDALREPDRRTYQGLGSGLYRSTDGGTTWARAGTPLFGPSPELGRLGIAIAPNNTNTVYVEASGLVGGHTGFFVSTDFGDTWTPHTSTDLVLAGYVYGWWFGRVWVDPADDDHVFVAGVELAESADGGTNWDNGGTGAHADMHAMMWDPKVTGRRYLGNDGGLYRSDNGAAWEQATVQPFSQLYGLDVGEQAPSRIVAGLQDNGVVRNYPADRRGNWNSYVGGDGQRALINPKDQDIVYGCYQYGACSVSHDGGNTTTEFTNMVVSSRKNWFTPIEFDPENPHTVYTGGEIMSRSDDDGASWTPISLDLSNGPGRETNPLFINYGTLTTIAPTAKGTIYAGTDDGNLWYTHDSSSLIAWTKASDPDLPKAWVTRVEADQSNPMTAYVTYSGFRTGDDAAYVLRTTDGGVNWTNITGDLPRAPVNDINIVGDTLVVASDVGVFFTRDGGTHWFKAGAGLPLVPIFELRTHFPTRTLYAASFGRGVWKVAFDALAAPVTNALPVLAPMKAKRLTLGLPRTRSCKRGARLRFKLRAPKGTRLKSATISVNGHRVKTLSGRALTRTVRLRLPRSRARVTIVAKTTTGTRLVGKRTYRACPKRR